MTVQLTFVRKVRNYHAYGPPATSLLLLSISTGNDCEKFELPIIELGGDSRDFQGNF